MAVWSGESAFFVELMRYRAQIAFLDLLVSLRASRTKKARHLASFFGFIEVFALLNVPVESVVGRDRNQFIQFA
ncbi:TPA: hypothetical protein ACGD12_004437 [Shigella sonnei]